MTATQATLAAMLADGNDGRTTTKGRAVYPPAGVYSVIPDSIQTPNNPQVKVINIHFDLAECLSTPDRDVQGRKMSTAFWCNNPDAVQRSADQLSYAIHGHPANAQVTMGEVAGQIIELSKADEWIVDREVVPGRDSGVFFTRDRFYTPDRWAAKEDVNITSEIVQDSGEALDADIADELAAA